MSLHRFCGAVVFECDGCDAEHDTGMNEFYSALEDVKAQGWKVVPIQSRKDKVPLWRHYCPECRDEH